jgi:Flp pilus assembly protein TadD
MHLTVYLVVLTLGATAGLSCRKSSPPPPASTSASQPAADSHDRSAEASGEELVALKDQADALTLAGRHEQAAEVYRRIITLDPTDRTNRFNLAVALGRMRLFSQAEEVYVQLLAEHPDFVQARYNLASLYQVQGKLTQACQQWQQVVHQAPRLVSAHVALGAALLDLGQAKAAADAYAEAAKLRSDDVGIWMGLAQAARAAGELGRAATAAQKAAQLSKTDPAAWRLLGDILVDSHRATGQDNFFTEAADAWRRSLELDGNQPDLRRLLDAVATMAENTPTTQKAP